MRYKTPTKYSGRTSFPTTGLRGLLLAAGILALLVSGLGILAAPPSKPALSLDQASNGGIGKTPVDPVDWENGNQNGQKAHYNEGESIPYRATLTGLTPGSTYTATFGYDITHSSKHAIDFITSRQRIAEDVFPCQSHLTVQFDPCEEGTPGQIPAPAGAAAGFFNTLVGFEGPQEVSIFNGDIPVNGVDYVVQGDEAAAQSETSFKVTFTVHPDRSTVLLSWGGHIARQADWGAGQAATGITGSPYHTRAKALQLPDLTTISIGNQDRALASSAVQPPSACTLTNDGTRACDTTGAGVVTTHSYQNGLSTSSTYSFSFVSGGATATITDSNTDPNAGAIFAEVTATGSYTIRLTVSNAAGTETCDASVTVDAQPVATDVPDEERCDTGAASDKEFTVDSAGSTVPVGGSVTWSIVNGSATIGDANAASTTITLNGPGSVTVRLTVAGPAGTSCISATNDAVLTLNSPPTVAISLENECDGTAQLRATASGGAGSFTYEWKKDGVVQGSTSDTLPVSAIGTYVVTVTDGEGCSGGATKKLCFELQNAP